MKKIKMIAEKKYNDTMDTAMELMLFHSQTPLGNKIRKLKENKNSTDKIDKDIMAAIKTFYSNEFHDFCEMHGWSTFDMLVYRRRELKNLYTYLSNFFLSVFTGLIACVVFAYFPVVTGFMAGTSGGVLFVLARAGVCILYMLSAITIPFIVMYIFKKCIMLIPPESQFYNEYELEIVEKMIMEMSVV